jgi:hypothetical protein
VRAEPTAFFQRNSSTFIDELDSSGCPTLRCSRSSPVALIYGTGRGNVHHVSFYSLDLVPDSGIIFIVWLQWADFFHMRFGGKVCNFVKVNRGDGRLEKNISVGLCKNGASHD